ncbi:haloacid dehalogenase [Mangrovactinospora gilvigrisea]|uniref:Haloacid dehalogenase n=1 Tax=Mangrovactinospora gilvigrisea TaxID=1428644 RepID=A0A1J7CF59_9ACTN|nr:phosphonatase-like hydrolase [Mangrovactinospora gilvigrisea]OIV38338.1 haloacid dehalogenase [Mangrovactinospora gilvigrisea]
MTDRQNPAAQVAVLDMAGTTVADDGAVEDAFRTAVGRLGIEDPAELDRMLGYVRETMGQSKITVFRSLLGDEDRAHAANAAFEDAYAARIAAGAVAPVPGAADAIAELRAAGVRVALATGFSRTTQDTLLAALGWAGAVDLTLCPADAGRGRPHPDLVLTAALRLAADDVRAVAAVGDTAGDMESGRRAGAGTVAGVLTGAHDAETLRAAGATQVLGSVRELPALLLGGERP